MTVLTTQPPTTRPSRDLARLSDEALLSLVASSDEDALAALYDRFGRVAYGLALRILRDQALAQDAVQEAFLGVWRNADRFLAERAKASTWILTLVHRRAVDLVRREDIRRGEPLERAPEPAEPKTAEDEASLGFQRRARPGGALAAAARAARGARARLLRRADPERARRAARPAARDDQEPDVHRPLAAARPARPGRARRLVPVRSRSNERDRRGPQGPQLHPRRRLEPRRAAVRARLRRRPQAAPGATARSTTSSRAARSR